MAQDPEEVTTDTTEDVDQPDDAVDDTQPFELPEDPEQLKEFAKTAASEKAQLQRERAQLQSERDRLKELEEEQRTKATYWATDAERLRTELQRVTKPPTAKETAAAQTAAVDDEELAVLVTNGMKLSDLKRMWQQDAEVAAETAASRKAIEVTQSGSHARQIVNDYPDLTNDNSPLTRATIAEMEIIDREDPSLSDRSKFELATRRSAARLGIAPRSIQPPAKSPEETERTRRRTAQGGPTGKPAGSKGTVVITDADRALARKMNGGQDVPDKILIEAKKRVEQGKSAQA
jgi:hypothetical protein